MKIMKNPTGLHPNLVFCYKSLTESLQELLLRPGFFEMCEEWRKYKNPSADIYDGNIWKEFQIIAEQPFLSLPYNFALHLNVDWFQPFSHTQQGYLHDSFEFT